MSVTDSGKLEIEIRLKTNKDLENELKEIEARGTKTGRTVGRELAGGANEGSAAYEKFQRTVERNEQQLRNLGLGATAAGAVIAGGIAFAIHQYAAFEESIARATGAAGGNREMMGQLAAIAREVSLEYARAGVTAKNAADVLFFLTSAGLSAADAQRVLRDVLKLAAGTQSDYEQMAKLVIQTTNGFNLSMGESARVVQFLAAMNQAGTIEMGELNSAMRQVASVAGGLKVGLEETGAALLIIRDSGRAAEQAGTDLRNIILRLLNPTTEGKDVLRQLGLAAKDVSPQLHTLGEIIELLRSRNMTAKQASELFTTEALAGYLALANKGGPAMQELEKRLTGTRAADAQLALQTEITKATFNEIRVVMSHLSEEIGELASKRVEPATQRFVDWLKVLKELPTPLKEMSVDLALISSGLLTVVGSGALALAFWAKFGVAITTAVTAISVFLLRHAPWIAAITAVGIALYELETRTGALSGAWSKLVGIGDRLFAMFESKATDQLTGRLDELNKSIRAIESGRGAGVFAWLNPTEHARRLNALKAERDAIQWVVANRGNAMQNQRAGERQNFAPPPAAPGKGGRGPAGAEPPDPKETEAFRDLARMADKAMPLSEFEALAQPLRAAVEKMKLPPEVEKGWMAWAASVASATLAMKIHDEQLKVEIKSLEEHDTRLIAHGVIQNDHLRVQQLEIDQMQEHDEAMVKSQTSVNKVTDAYRKYTAEADRLFDASRDVTHALAGEEEALHLTGAAANAARLSWQIYGRTLGDLTDDEREGIRLLAEKTQKLREQTAALERASQANELYARLSIAGLQDLTTATKIQAGLELQDRQQLTEQILDMRQRVADKEHTDHLNALREQQIRMQEESNVLGFFTASLAAAAAEAGSMWDGMNALAQSTAQNMQRAFSDLFFKVFTDETISAADLFKGFADSMLRAVSDMLATETVKAIMSIAKPAAASVASSVGEFLGPALSFVSDLFFHKGGTVGKDGGLGLGGDEFGIIAQRGEAILPRDLVDRLLPLFPDGDLIGGIQRAFSGTMFSSLGSGNVNRYLWEDYGEGSRRVLGPNTDLVTGEQHPLFPNGSQAWADINAALDHLGGLRGLSSPRAVDASRLFSMQAFTAMMSGDTALAGGTGSSGVGLGSTGYSGVGLGSIGSTTGMAGPAFTGMTGNYSLGAAIAAALGLNQSLVGAITAQSPTLASALFGSNAANPEFGNLGVPRGLLGEAGTTTVVGSLLNFALGTLTGGSMLGTMFAGTNFALQGLTAIMTALGVNPYGGFGVNGSSFSYGGNDLNGPITDGQAAMNANIAAGLGIGVGGAMNFTGGLGGDGSGLSGGPDGGAFHTGGRARLLPGEIVVPERPFAQELPGLSRWLERRESAGGGAGLDGEEVKLRLRLTVEFDQAGLTETVVSGIKVRASVGDRMIPADAVDVAVARN